MSNFTPGPWHTENEPGDWGLRGAVRVYGDGKEICAIEYTTPYCAGASRSDIEECRRAQADAQLIAAAPEMYEALKVMLASAMPHPVEHPTMTAAWKIARAALAKAEGKQALSAL